MPDRLCPEICYPIDLKRKFSAAGRRGKPSKDRGAPGILTTEPVQQIRPAMSPQEPAIRQVLQRHMLFSRLTDAQLTRIARTAVRVCLEENENLFEQGTEAGRFYLVISGQVKLFRLSPAGDEKIIEIITDGHTFAEALMFLERPVYPVSATALQKTELVSIHSREFASILRESMDTCFLIMGDMSQRLRGLVQEIDELTLQSATCRVAAYLLHHTDETENSVVLDLPKQVLASRLSVTPETFSRILRRLSDSGVIGVQRDVVHIHDRRELSKAADQFIWGR